MTMDTASSTQDTKPTLPGLAQAKAFEAARNARLAEDIPASYVPIDPQADPYQGLAEAELALVRKASGLVS